MKKPAFFKKIKIHVATLPSESAIISANFFPICPIPSLAPTHVFPSQLAFYARFHPSLPRPSPIRRSVRSHPLPVLSDFVRINLSIPLQTLPFDIPVRI
jgi:hypothetical protein